MKPIIVIPARLASTRLPRKPLAEIGGRTMIEQVALRALEADLGRVVVAAGDQEIIDAVAHLNGVEAVLTAPDLPSGSDRVHAALQRIDPAGEHDVVVNFQGDLPSMDPQALRAVLAPVEGGVFDIGTLVAPIHTDEELCASQIVKVACTFDDHPVARGVYFSRLPVPSGAGQHWHHIGIYAWCRQALERFVTLPPSGLERRESLEQLRALENGMSIGCVRIAEAPRGVDTADDLAFVRKAFTCP
ncbi:3-deoxy-manno-octulosonate cytidylyltransferase [Neokomagataea anthophila]|uniref:3-deoxy-manno-octulosonate cytidylyltransferase n=1 Tax=Neokomagataea anthophila TaxID=2826925 RepID=A0ABS5E6L8_9PROT|nr:3-deoxy-manno-octulosonate cytidylyltransferase [Neokomagataea anthophila]MBR0559552.1 3-deoxy-manno-octulosonate cytidylyltransferase [Neokomagataea anthophila]